jgi:IS5 family transposase
MLWIYFLQQWYALSDEALEDAMYDSQAMRDFIGIDLAIERTKASDRAKIEHPFHVIKNLFGYRKVRYNGLAKNEAQLFSLFALANLVLATRCEGQIDGG